MKACALLVFVVAVVAAAEAKRIQLRDTSIGVDTVPTISQLPHRIAALQRDYDADTHHQFFVHLDGPLTLDQRRAIERDYDIDFPVHFYFPEHSFLIVRQDQTSYLFSLSDLFACPDDNHRKCTAPRTCSPRS